MCSLYSTSSTTDWQRIERVIRECRTSVLPFALRLGFKRADVLYEIKHCERRMTLPLAVRIARVFPRYSLSWLMTGRGMLRTSPRKKRLSSQAAIAGRHDFHIPLLLGRWEMIRSFCLSGDSKSGLETEAFFAAGEIVWDFLSEGKVVQYENGKRVAEVDYLFDPVSGNLFVEQSVLQVIRLNVSQMEFLDCSDCPREEAAVFIFRPCR